MIKLFLASPCCMELNLAKIEKVPEEAMKRVCGSPLPL
jgi:hypothetical protein